MKILQRKGTAQVMQKVQRHQAVTKIKSQDKLPNMMKLKRLVIQRQKTNITKKILMVSIPVHIHECIICKNYLSV